MQFREALSKMEPYVPGKKRPGAIKLSSNENPLGPSPKAVEAVERMLSELHVYPDGGATALREAIARKHGLATDQVIVGNGSDEVLTLAAASLIEPGDRTVTAEHTFSQYAFATRLYGGEIVPVAMKEGRFDLDAILDALRSLSSDSTPGSGASGVGAAAGGAAGAPGAAAGDAAGSGAAADRRRDTTGPAGDVISRPRIVFLCNPNNPTGTYRNHDELRAFLGEVPREILVVIDEAYADYALAPDFPRSEELLEEFDNLLVLRTFSKIYGIAGLRVGYGLASSELIAALNRARQPFNANAAAQTAALAALGDEAHRIRSVELNQASLTQMQAALEERGIRYFPTQANFICIDLERDTAPIYEKLAAGGITVRTLHSFGLPTRLRITLGPLEVMSRLVDLLDSALAAV